ncbi:hypothetical protein [Flavobacterium sp.]|uniref:hypothetical protein n=1 Tax=Flavobacterium sp. TaxID=239 RepID=UPI0037533214
MNFNYEDIENRKFVKKFNIKDLELSNIDSLIFNNVYTENEPFQFEISSFTKTESTEFETNIYLNSKKYHLNETILKEIYVSIRFFIEIVTTDVEFDLNKILTNIEARIEKTDKIKYLQKKHRDLYSKVKNESEYLVYAEIKELNGYLNWEDLVFDYLSGESEFIKKYLTSDFEISDIPKHIFEMWKKYYLIKTQIDFCKEQINVLQSIENKPNFIDTSLQVFLLEEIINIKDWSSISATKKGNILCHLLGKNKDNIKKIYLELDKKSSENSEKLLNDRKKADEIIKKLLG